MKLQKHLPYVLSLWMLCLSLVGAAQSSVKAAVSKKKVKVGERFRYDMTLININGHASLPPLDNLQMVGGPMTNSRITTVMGKRQSIVTESYFLTATAQGKLTIQPFTVTTKNGVLKSNAITIEVDPADEPSSPKEYNITGVEDKDVFLRLHTSKRKVYKGEQFVISYVLYSTTRTIDPEDHTPPQHEGFWTENVSRHRSGWDYNPKVVNGHRYFTYTISQQVLVPQKTGSLPLDRLNLNLRLIRGFSQYDEFTLTSNTTTIEVLPLPTPPEDFNGAIGELRLQSSLAKRNITTGQSVPLTVEIKGNGNLNLIPSLALEMPPSIEIFDPSVDEDLYVNAKGMGGTKTFTYSIVPQKPGKYRLPAVTMVYFNTKEEKYITLRTAPTDIIVTGTAVERADDHADTVDDDTLLPHADSGTWRKRNRFFAGSTTHILLFILPILLLIGLRLWKKQRDKERLDVTGMRSKKAGAKALHELTLAKTALKDNKKESFYESVFDAIHHYLSEKLNLPYSELSKDVIGQQLQQKNIDVATINDLKKVLADCEMARFAPRANTDDHIMLQTAETIIHRLEKQLT